MPNSINLDQFIHTTRDGFTFISLQGVILLRFSGERGQTRDERGVRVTRDERFSTAGSEIAEPN